MKCVKTAELHRAVISVLMVLIMSGASPFIFSAFSFAESDPSDFRYGVYQTVPWRITKDFELVLGEKGRGYTFDNDGLTWNYPWHYAVYGYGRSEMLFFYYHQYVKKVTVPGVVHASGNACCLFRDFQSAEDFDIEYLSTNGATSLQSMFESCSAAEAIDISYLSTGSVTDVTAMFRDCRKLKSVDLSCFSDAQLRDMTELFHNCVSLESVDLTGVDTSEVSDLGNLFSGCVSLKRVDLSGFDTRSAGAMEGMFANTGIEEIALGENTILPDAHFGGAIRRVRTLDGDLADGPEYSDINEYDGSAPGWYSVDNQSGNDDVVPGPESTLQVFTVYPWEDGFFDDQSPHGTPETTAAAPAAVRKKITSVTLKKSKYGYTGKRVKPAVTVKYRTKKLKKGVDYTVSYSKNKAVGRAKVTVTGKGKYKGTIRKTFRIVPDRPKVRASTFRIIEGTQIKISVSSKCRPKYYELILARDPACKQIIAKKKLGRKKLVSGKIFAYTHLKKGKPFYVRIRLIGAGGIEGRPGKVVKIKGRG